MIHNPLFRFMLAATAASAVQADQLALWDFDDAIIAGTVFVADQEYVLGSPTLTIANQDIDTNGKAGNNYTDSLGVYQDSPDANDAIAWNEIRGSGADGEVVIAIDTRDYQDLSFSFEYKYNNISANEGVDDLMELLYSTNGVIIDTLAPTPGGFHPRVRGQIPSGPIGNFPRQFGRVNYQP